MEEISIKDWIESDDSKSLELRNDHDKWKLFEIIPSKTSFNSYKNIDTETRKVFGNHIYTVVNITYAKGVNGYDVEGLKREMGKVLISLRDSAIGIKVEGLMIGEGKLIIQDRMPITIAKCNDKEGHYKIIWRGAITRIDENSQLIQQDQV